MLAIQTSLSFGLPKGNGMERAGVSDYPEARYKTECPPHLSPAG